MNFKSFKDCEKLLIINNLHLDFIQINFHSEYYHMHVSHYSTNGMLKKYEKMTGVHTPLINLWKVQDHAVMNQLIDSYTSKQVNKKSELESFKAYKSARIFKSPSHVKRRKIKLKYWDYNSYMGLLLYRIEFINITPLEEQAESITSEKYLYRTESITCSERIEMQKQFLEFFFAVLMISNFLFLSNNINQSFGVRLFSRKMFVH